MLRKKSVLTLCALAILLGFTQSPGEIKRKTVPTRIVLSNPGREDFVNYEKYGEFQGIGTKDYKYAVKDPVGLGGAQGEGIYPKASVLNDPEYKKAINQERLRGSHWDFVNSPDLEAAFLKWATAPEPEGVRLFYMGLILEKSGLIKQAIKRYYAIVVHFPKTSGWSYWQTPWYVSQAAIGRINYLLKHNPQIGYRLAGADVRVINGYDNNVANDIVVTNPGRFVKVSLFSKLKIKPFLRLKTKRRLGAGKVSLIQYTTGGWQLAVDGKPYIIKGMTYTPTKVGESPDEGTMTSWMFDDFNHNGKIDGPYDAFVDRNRNNIQDKDEPAAGDFKLMKEMGVNTIRLYHHPFKVNKELLRELYKNYGIRVIMGDFLGKYALGSGAPWNQGTDYNNEEHKKNMMESVINMVKEFKDEPYILFWLLGNENVYGTACNADKYPGEFFKFANEAAKKIKSLDAQHPVAIDNGDVLFLDKFGKAAPDIDIFGCNAYRGNYGFYRIWQGVKEEADKPVFIAEFGCPAYAAGKSADEAEVFQADYFKTCWEDIEDNMFSGEGRGNAVGGIVFEWLDEWWKDGYPLRHDIKGSWPGPFLDSFMYEEWLGICGQGDGLLSPFLRQLRKPYYTFKKIWK